MTNRILEAVCADPWLITESGMRQIVAIAERQADLEALDTIVNTFQVDVE